MRKTFLITGISISVLVITYFVFAFVSERFARYHGQEENVETDSVGFIPPTPKILYGINIDSMAVDEGVIQRDENLSTILARYNVSPRTIYEISNLPNDSFDVRKLKVKKPYTIIHQNDSLKTARAFIYHPNAIEFVVLDFADSLLVHHGMHQVDTITEVTSGVIESSLYNVVLENGGSAQLVNELADVYAWEIDFFGLQKDDAYKVIYERYEVQGQHAGMGKIKGAWFRHAGSEYYAVQYDQGEGTEYFDEQGNSLRKTFLKAPLKFSRISSRFTYSRFHPVLKIRRPHTGVDYAAPKGTPVVTVGDGTVIMAAYSGGGGNTVKIKHNSSYTTAYNHLSGYGKGIKKGVKVKQGQVIGYVGTTGLSTGPHLDFRFWKNGQPVDPLKIDPPSANPVNQEHWDKYVLVKDTVIKALNAIKLEPIVGEEQEKIIAIGNQ